MRPGKNSARVRWIAIRMAAVSIALGICLLPVVAHAQQAAAPKRILILYWYNREYAGNITFEQNFRTSLQSVPPGTVEYYSEYLESNRFPGENQALLMRNYLREKYVDRNIDVIIAVTDKPLEFLLKYRRELFTNVPIVFGAVKPPTSTELAAGPGITGIVYGGNQKSTLELALRLHPDAEQVFIVSGTLDRDKRFELACRKDLEGYESKVSITYLTDQSLGELIANLRSLPERSIVLYLWQQSYDEKGGVLESPDVLALISLSTRVPIYGLTTPMLGSGIVGGNLRAPENIATGAAEIAMRIITGTRAQDIPLRTPPTVPMFDWSKLRRWGISEDRLPPGSIVRFRKLSFWDEYKWYAIDLVSVIVLQSALIAGLIINRSRRKRAEEHLRESETRRLLAQEAARIGTFEWNIQTGVNIWSQDFEAMHGLSPGSFGGSQSDWENLIHPDDRSRVVASVDQAVGTGAPVEEEWRVRWPDGSTHWVFCRFQVFPDSNGAPLTLTGINIDITDRKLADEFLHESEERFRMMADTAPVLIWMSGPDKLCTYFNRQWLEFTGRTMEQELGNGWAEGVHPEDYEQCLVTYWSAFDSRGSFDMEYRLRQHDGEYRWVMDAGVPRFMPDGTFAGYIGTCMDITERRRAEESLQQTQAELAHVARVMITGELVATIAHEVNQPLTAMVANANATRRMLGNGKENLDEAREAIDDIVKDAHRASEVVGRIRSLLRKDPHRTEPLGINDVIEEVVAIARNDLVGKRVTLRMELGEGLPKVEADRVQIQQVILNLTMNAVEAMRSKEEGGRNLLMKTRRNGAEGVVVEVEDSGVGIAPERLEQIFEAFYTTRPEGMGMGLAICRTIIETHGGKLWAESNKEKGATFRFTVPASIGEAS